MFEIDDSLSFLIAKCHQKAFQLTQERLRSYNITAPQAVTLSFLFKKDGINQLQLGELVEKDRTTISGILDRLEAVGYVKRVADSEDRRSSLIYVTPAALAIREDLEAAALEVNNILADGLSESEMVKLIVLLKKIRRGR